MTAPRIGSLFSGYGGLDMGVMAALGGSVAWHVEWDKAPSKILAHHWPDVPNYGDVTTVNWADVEPVDVITGGSPCQDLSHAGKRAGMTEGTRSNLWVAMREAIAALQPSLVVWENVRGAYTAPADSEVEPCAGCVGDGPGPHLRALGRVLGDLSDLGFDAGWHGLRAADIGAPHGRYRVFVVAQNTNGTTRREWRLTAPRQAAGGRSRPDLSGSDREGLALLGTPRASEWKGSGPVGSKSHTHRLNRDYLDAQVIQLTADQRLLPTPRAVDADTADPLHRRSDRRQVGDVVRIPSEWGVYADAIARWETLTRPAPEPTQLSAKGNPQLSPAFVEWMMGLPEGHVTGVPGLSRNDMLKALGNGVCPAQAEAATRILMTALAGA